MKAGATLSSSCRCAKMPRIKFEIGEKVELRCYFVRDQQIVHDWLAGVVVRAEARMLAVEFDADVFSNNGWRIPERILWCTHGSPNLRRIQHGHAS
jgi:hypothetical protein